MDSGRFDALARTWHAAASRRRAFLGGAFGTFLTLIAGGPAEGKKKKGKGKGKKKGCARNEKRCGSRCVPKFGCCDQYDCDVCRNEVCVKGRCGCEAGAFRDHEGYCAKPPLCQSKGELCESDQDCCSLLCNIDDGQGQLRCNSGKEACNIDLDCDPGFLCKGFTCTSPNCHPL